MIWLISDTHFGHTNIISYCNRPFSNAAEMDEFIAERWVETVKPGDIVYHLGDVYMGASGRDVIGKLPGRKRLILGNHDNGKDQVLQRAFQKITMWRMFPEHGVLLSHVPIHNESIRGGLINVHGHIHNNQSPSDRHRCVCVEHTNYTPVPIEGFTS